MVSLEEIKLDSSNLVCILTVLSTRVYVITDRLSSHWVC